MTPFLATGRPRRPIGGHPDGDGDFYNLQGREVSAVSHGDMETLREALARLEDRGFRQPFRATPGGELELAGEPPLAPETLVVEETVRFEGTSDPADEAVLFALRSRDDRIRGTFVASFGPQMDPACAEVMHRLAPDPNRRRTAQARP